MRIAISTILDAPVAQAWAAAQKPALFEHVSAPMVGFRPKDPASLPAVWHEGRFLVTMLLGGLLPIGDQWIVIEFEEVDDTAGRYVVRDNGHSASIRRWDHRLTLQARPDGRTDYSDVLELEAGLTTAFVWLFAQVFYRHRQKRLRALAARGFEELGA
jgi:hypothetical protein